MSAPCFEEDAVDTRRELDLYCDFRRAWAALIGEEPGDNGGASGDEFTGLNERTEKSLLL